MNNDVVIINLDRPRQLKYTHKAMKYIAAELGKGIEEIDSNLNPANFEMMETLLFAGLQADALANGETLEREQIEGLLDYAPSVIYTFEKFLEAWKVAWGVSEGNQPTPVELENEKSTTGTKVSE